MAKKKSATRRILIVVFVLLGLLVVFGVVGRATGIIGDKDESTVVEVVKVDRRSVTQVVTASGKVQPEIEVKISSDVSGEIIALPVNEGDAVEQGALLARIKPDFYVAQVEQAEASVLQAKATLAQRLADMLNAELDFKRQKDLYEKEVVPETEFQRAQTQYDIQKAAHEGAQYSVQNAEARLREAKENLAKTSIYPPMRGTVSKLDEELGERVVGTSQMTGTEMMRIAKLNQMEMEVDVNENDVVNVALGDTAHLEVDAYPEQVFRGVVTEIANSARVMGTGTQEQVTNFPVKIRILDSHNTDVAYADGGGAVADQEMPPPDRPLPNFRPGMSGTVDVFTQTMKDVIAIPIQAVTVRDFAKLTKEGANADSTGADTPAEPEMREDLRRVVFLMVEGKARLTEVETGIADDTHIVIKSGLEGGESVIIGPYRAVSRTLEQDAPVKLQGQDKEGGPGVFAAKE
jgi:HlyD family secretion protein